jgi:hypothetical protein
VHIIIGGKPKAALVETLNGARFVDSNTEYRGTYRKLC